jgi:methyl-accepting chemotaxis protein
MLHLFRRPGNLDGSAAAAQISVASDISDRAAPAALGSESPIHSGLEPNSRQLDPETVDILETDVLQAIRGVTQAIEAASGEVAGTRDDLTHIHTNMAELATAGRGAASQTGALAASTEQLAASSGEIAGAMSHARSKVDEAVTCARDASALIAELAKATEEIVGIVDTISTVAHQTNLLALNATIEAARAGAVGRGFAVVASEVKSLSVETGNAANDIRTRIERLRASAGSSIGAVEKAAAAIQELQPVFGSVRTAVDEQSAATAEVAQCATEASTFVREMSERAHRVDTAASAAMQRIAGAGAASTEAVGLAKALGQRFVAVMRQSELGDRRRYDRFPTDLRVGIHIEGRAWPIHTVDISQSGLLIANPEGISIQKGMSLDLDLERVGRLGVRVVDVSPIGVHCEFARLDGEMQARIAHLVAEVAEEYRPLIDAARHSARCIENALEQAVAQGRLTRDQIFDTQYRPVAGTDPQQFETLYLRVLEDLLPAVQEPLLLSDTRMVFCIAVDRNGYIPVHNRKYSQPQRTGEPVWNTANCRNKRIFDDRAGITAARSTRPFLVQAYARDMGGQTVMLREVDAPIRLFDRHWGAFRTAYRL